MASDAALFQRAFEPLAAAAKGNARALLKLAGEARHTGDLKRCYQLAQDALELEPANPEIVFEARSLLARTVPSWHFPMMNDQIRNLAFQNAIERAIRPGLKVLDIGSGSGLLAMMAARAGAEEVHSCEMNPAIAATAQEIVAKNGFADRVKIHSCSSRELDPETDMGGQADLVISEIIGKDFVGERVLPTMQDAVHRLAKPNARFIPSGGEIRIAPAYYAGLDNRRVGEVCGFDLSPFNTLAPARFNVQANDPALELRGEKASLFAFDFASTQPHPERSRLDLVATGGTVNGVVQWFRLQLDESESFENEPGPASSRSWALIFFPLAEPVDASPGDRIAVAASISKDYLTIRQA